MKHDPLPRYEFGSEGNELSSSSILILDGFISFLVDFLRAPQPSYHLVSCMTAYAHRLQNINMEALNYLDMDPLKTRAFFFIHSQGKLSNETLQGSRILHRATAALFCIAIALQKPKTRLEKLASFLTYHDYMDIFQESDILAYTSPWVEVEPQISHVLVYMTRSVLKKMEHMNTCFSHDTNLANSEKVLSQLASIISLSYKFQLRDPLHNLLSIGFAVVPELRVKLGRILSRSLESTRVCRQRDHEVSLLLWDVCKKVTSPIPTKYLSHLHIHPFLAPSILYRFTKNLQLLGLTKDCSLSCLGIHIMPKQPHPFIAPLQPFRNESRGFDISIILSIISTLENVEIPLLLRNIGNLSTITSLNLLLYERQDKKLISVLLHTMLMFPTCPYAHNGDVVIEHSILDLWLLNFNIMLKYLASQDKKQFKERNFNYTITCFLEKFVSWGSVLTNDPQDYRKWKRVLGRKIACLITKHGKYVIELLIPIICKVECLRLTVSTFKKCESILLKDLNLALIFVCCLVKAKNSLLTLKLLSSENPLIFKVPLKFFSGLYCNEKTDSTWRLQSSIVGAMKVAPKNATFLLDTFGYELNTKFILQLKKNK